jgi:hypothetical protein
VVGVLGREPVEQLGRRRHDRPRSRVVGVERPQRIGLEASAHLLRELAGVLAQVRAKLLPVVGAGLRCAEARQPQAKPRHDVPGQHLGEQKDELGVEGGVVGAERLRPDLGELAETAGLGRLVAEERPRVPALDRLRRLVQAVLDVGATHARRPLRPQGDRPPAGILEGEHLLLDDVGGLPHPAGE